MKFHPVVFMLYSGHTMANANANADADEKVTGIAHYSMNSQAKEC
jgi:hypothetical protein